VTEEECLSLACATGRINSSLDANISVSGDDAWASSMACEVTPGIYNRGGYAGQPVRGAQHRQGLRSDDRELGAAST
jgi:hypothetical protein